MAFCGKCGQQVNEGVNFCPACGAPMATAANQSAQQEQQEQQAQSGQQSQQASAATDTFGSKLGSLNDTADNTADFDQMDIEQNKVMAILAYILVLIPILAAPNSKFARYHSNQGLILLIAVIGWAIAETIVTAILRVVLWSGAGLWSIYALCSTILNLIYIVFTVLAVIGIINVVNGRVKELPVIGKYKILK